MIRRKEQMRTSEKPNLRGGEGVIHAYDLLEAPEMREKLKLCSILTIEPGCSIGEHPHGPDAEFYYLLEGELEVTDNGEKTTFHPGDAMFTACGETHSARNNTQKDAKLLAIVIA
ncbi:cupin domain-containing protein [Intestinimonas sp. MSJ-38]|uniref:cupin domain-containing protein n=1 Tax=Intestinimonas sp. MSJ-38 TaxID=2841532 RepID=UPI001C11E90C|nr:cupin domain-containing protein [Intestinimonas sp. MSJ-38]MBU5431137.1 cupin domain-containing protein [Intestinimonas sp. MSJ-38]